MFVFRISYKALLSVLLLAFFVAETSASSAPRHVVFTYMGDPSTTLTVNWQTIADVPIDADGEAVVYYDTDSHGGVLAQYANRMEGSVSQIPGLENRVISRVQLSGLLPDTTYHLVVANSDTSVSAEMKVKTIPADDSALRFVTGGDMGTSEDTRTLLRHSATYDPDFAVIGGDIAYTDGNLKNIGSWDKWLDYYTEEMVTPYGYAIPVVLAVGNHELKGSFGQPKANAPFFFGFFGQCPDNSYFVRQFGANFVLFVLDSGHVTEHALQADWMRTQFPLYENLKYKAAVYHVPLYPSHRDFMSEYSEQGREFWAPVFDEFGLTVAFENHDHTFKRSHLIKDGVATGDTTGTLYLGDGCWGRSVRSIDYEQRWYLDAVGSLQHFWVVDISNEKATYRAVDLEGRTIDVYPQTESDAIEAATVLASLQQLYTLPDGVFEIDGFYDVGEEWAGGETTLTLNNPWDSEASCTLKPLYPKELLELDGFSDEPIVLKPGVTEVLTVSFAPKEGQAVERKLIRSFLKVQVDYVVAGGAGEKSINLTRTEHVQLRIGDAEVGDE